MNHSDFYPPHNSISATVKALRDLCDYLKDAPPGGKLAELVMQGNAALNGSTDIEAPAQSEKEGAK